MVDYEKIINELDKSSQKEGEKSPINNEEENKEDQEKNESKIKEEEKEIEIKEEEKEEKEGEDERMKINEKKIRKSREPKMIPAWKAEIEKKKLLKQLENEKKSLLEEIEKLRSQKNQTQSDDLNNSNLEEKVKLLAEKYDIDEGFLKDLVSFLKPSLIQEDIIQKLNEIEEIKEQMRIKEEDLIFEDEFKNKILPQLGKANDKEIQRIKDAIKKDYFKEKYITLEIDEIFKLKKDDYLKYITNKETVESGSKNQLTREFFNKNIGAEDLSKMNEKELEEYIELLRKSDY